MTEANAGDSGSSPGSRRPPGEMAPHCSVPDCEIPGTEGTSGLTVRRVTISPTVTGATEQEQHCSITAVPLRTHRLPTGSARPALLQGHSREGHQSPVPSASPGPAVRSPQPALKLESGSRRDPARWPNTFLPLVHPLPPGDSSWRVFVVVLTLTVIISGDEGTFYRPFR